VANQEVLRRENSIILHGTIQKSFCESTKNNSYKKFFDLPHNELVDFPIERFLIPCNGQELTRAGAHR